MGKIALAQLRLRAGRSLATALAVPAAVASRPRPEQPAAGARPKLGAALGFTAAGFAGAVPLGVYPTVALVAFGGVALTILAALIPARSPRRLPTARLLAEE